MSRFTFTPTPLQSCFVIEPKPLRDERGYFERFFCTQDFEEIGLKKPIMQINHSKTIGKGSVRGLHYQTPPFCETKIVRCIKGAIYDVAVDLRKDSPTFLQYFGIELNETNAKYLYIPEGFAHGFQSLSDEVEIFYLATQAFCPEADSAINALDPTINIKWQFEITNISTKDKNAPCIDNNFKGLVMNTNFAPPPDNSPINNLSYSKLTISKIYVRICGEICEGVCYA
ncbi:dTDP-4-dehydrorhamnose 3,5-epimerase [Helicobacter fennelliae]|uniref:dTDP-4-dehydrorhamnose 3,5-epimerase n=1 Tax=Helicobacter fennelliae TaxID=215 RepID=UPI000E06707F|nr:dTDP-4-dehydrorhamnose 3,5-epimerase [Helicobacter fennelliae]STQ83764.1 dTDP-4-dehydrorhamnose 3,5-epimerase [Helicobacter fennelliae]